MKDSLWLGLESQSCYPRKLTSLPFINNIDHLNHLKNNIIVYNTLLVWRDARKYQNIPPVLSFRSPLALNPDLPAQIRSIGLMEWASKGLSNFMDLLDSHSVKQFEQIRADFNIPHKDFYKYLQIRHFIGSLLRTGKIRMGLSEFENTIILAKSPKKLMFHYSILKFSGYDFLKPLWERDLEVTFNPIDWDKICSGVFPKCTSISIHEQNFKFFFRTYYTPVRLQRMFPDTSNLCYKCKIHKGTLIHLFWSCDRIQTFWKGVHSVIQEVTGKIFLLTSSLCLLSHTLDNLFDADTKSLLIILLFLAKKCILLRWSTPQVPTVDMWLSQISALFPIEKLTHDLNHKSVKFWRIWEPVHSFLQKP